MPVTRLANESGARFQRSIGGPGCCLAVPHTQRCVIDWVIAIVAASRHLSLAVQEGRHLKYIAYSMIHGGCNGSSEQAAGARRAAATGSGVARSTAATFPAPRNASLSVQELPGRSGRISAEKSGMVTIGLTPHDLTDENRSEPFHLLVYKQINRVAGGALAKMMYGFQYQRSAATLTHWTGQGGASQQTGKGVTTR